MGKTLDKEKRVQLSPGTPIMNNTIAWNLPLVKQQMRLGRHLFELESNQLQTYEPEVSSATTRVRFCCLQEGCAAVADGCYPMTAVLSHNSGTGNRGTTRSLRECTYKDFLNCHPLNFKGTEGVVVLAQWFEKMESVFHISNSAVENQVKFATCTFVRNTLTWWNSHMKVVTQDVAYAMGLEDTEEDDDKLALMCGRMFPEESDEVEKYVGGLPDMIRGNMMSYRPQTMEEAIEFSNNQMDQKLITITEGKLSRRERPCAPRCNKCKKIGHLARDCRSSGPNNNNNNRGNSGATQNAATCYECGVQGHYKRDCPKLKNGNRGNQRGNGSAPAKVYVVGNAGTNPDSNVVTGDSLLKNAIASILFDY
ncbi:putative reverse transcriptase domain-containing protein [Tanacetum coccineum]|uniref:Reverse transcriptase domain-containing protein n=1 Tax=Tanacetum coccineum TaxID=301880 RepID=A0ABQ5A3P2_9ASTR